MFREQTYLCVNTNECSTMLSMPADSHQEPHPLDGNHPTSLKSLILFAVIVMVIVLPIRLFIAKPFIVSGTSMFPTFDTWHYLIIDQISYRFNEPERGDVIVFRFPQDPSRFFIKRIIGLPGERVVLSGNTVTIFNDESPEGFVLDEPYVDDEHQKPSNSVSNLGDNEYFVLGDNRAASSDSRYWGPLEDNKITGRAYVRLFPFNSIGTYPGK